MDGDGNKPETQGVLPSMTFITPERIGRPPLPTHEQERLVLRAKEGDVQARQELVEHNMGFIIQIVARYGKAMRKLGSDDAINTGVIGYLTALDKFDPSRGFKFNSYADQWIRYELQMAIGQLEPGSPKTRNEVATEALVQQTKSDLWVTMGREPTPEEVGEAMHLTKSRTRQVRMQQAQSILGRPNADSMDEGHGYTKSGDDLWTLHDRVASTDPSFADPLDQMIRYEEEQEAASLASALLGDAMSKLKPIAREVISRRYGFDGYKPTESFEDIGRDMGISTREATNWFVNSLRTLRKEVL